MKVLIALTYYRPHYSGLTIYTERLAQGLVKRGHHVTVLTSRFNNNLPSRETCSGVQVIRLPVLARVSKGVLMPSIPLLATYQSFRADVVNLHLPQLDAAPISIVSRIMGKPVVLTYHCDLLLPRGIIHSVANQVSHAANWISGRAANAIVTNTQDYAENSPFLRKFLHKVRIIPTPVQLPRITPEDIKSFRYKYGIEPGQRIIGMAARFATEKGVEYLIQALPQVHEQHPDARVLFVGQHENVLGEEQYAARLKPLIERLGARWSFLGVISPTELAVYYRECDVLVLPSINGTESFGMVQVEAMICGTPVVASDLPGVRQPVLTTGMGKIVPLKDGEQLAKAIIEILDHPEEFEGDTQEVSRFYSPENIAEKYEALFMELCANGIKPSR